MQDGQRKNLDLLNWIANHSFFRLLHAKTRNVFRRKNKNSTCTCKRKSKSLSLSVTSLFLNAYNERNFQEKQPSRLTHCHSECVLPTDKFMYQSAPMHKSISDLIDLRLNCSDEELFYDYEEGVDISQIASSLDSLFACDELNTGHGKNTSSPLVLEVKPDLIPSLKLMGDTSVERHFSFQDNIFLKDSCSINSSLEVIAGFEPENITFSPVSAKTKYCSLDSVVTSSSISSYESLQSAVSDSFNSFKLPHCSAINLDSEFHFSKHKLFLSSQRMPKKSANIQVLSPISDKSHEPSDNGISQKNSPQEPTDSVQADYSQTSKCAQNLCEGFRNIHLFRRSSPHQCNESDSGISTDIVEHDAKLNDLLTTELPFDMPKLRRKIAAAKLSKCSFSSSNSSLSSKSLNEKCSLRKKSEEFPQTSSFGLFSESLDLQRDSLALDLGFPSVVTPEKCENSEQLSSHLWYHGTIGKVEAENILRNHIEGAYLVRSLTTTGQDYSMTLKSARGFMHLKIKYSLGDKSYTLGTDDRKFYSISSMLHFYCVHKLPIKGAEHMILLYPVLHETL